MRDDIMKKVGEPVTAHDLLGLHEKIVAYGDLDAPYWFLGLEEGCHPPDDRSLDEFVRGLIETAEHHRDDGATSLDEQCGSGSRTTYQTTWGAYVKLLFAIERAAPSSTEVPWTLEDVKRYQRARLGQKGRSDVSDATDELPRSCLMELFALPRSRRRPWPYGGLSAREGLGYLATARGYEKQFASSRARALMALADLHAPAFLMCFGNVCRNILGPHIGVPVEECTLDVNGKQVRVSLAERGATTIVFARHPAAHGTSDAYWVSLGRLLSERRGSDAAYGSLRTRKVA